MSNDNRRFKIKIMPAATVMMASHLEFLAQVSIPAASRLEERLKADIQSLKFYPERCPVYECATDITGDFHSLLSNNRYRIVFEIIGDTLFVYDIQDCRQDSDKHLL